MNHLQTIFKDDDLVIVLCIYCHYKDQTEQTVTNLVASLLKQIVQHPQANLDNVKSLYTVHKNQGTRPTLDDFITAFGLETRSCSKVFIVVDALDECREEDGTRARLLKALRSLAGNVNLMVTSRDLPSIARDFEGKKRLTIRARDEDVTMYIRGRITLGPRHLRNLEGTIVNKIVENVKGM